MRFLLDTDHINRDDGFANRIDCIKSRIDVVDSQFARLQQGSELDDRGLDSLIDHYESDAVTDLGANGT
jgi:hypothetical protein